MKILTERKSSALFDGDHGLGHLVATHSMNLAIQKAQASGVGLVTVRNTNDFGMAANYAMLGLEKDCIGLVLANTLPWVAPWGGKEKILGTNPICVAIPADKRPPVVFDFATSQVSHSRIEIEKELGHTIPIDWALDKSGATTTDPIAALKGALLPVGGYKGYGLSLIVDILTGALAGMTCGSKIEEISLEKKSTNAQTFLALRVSAFEEPREFKSRVDVFIDQVKSSPPKSSQSRIIMPGELENEISERRRTTGIPFNDEIWSDIVKLGKEIGINVEH